MLSLVPSPQHDPPPPQPGETVGPWVLEGLLGEGTMGRVFRARHQKLGRQVALKVLHARHLHDATLVARFLQEARLVNQINHPHIVEVNDFVEELEPRRVYCVMELLEGQTLAETLKARPLSLDESCRLARQVAEALEAAHQVGVVHRDLKPDNVFLCRGDALSVKVLDFGVAKLLQRAGDLRVAETQQGVMVGTPRYMAPEQAAGVEVAPRTDVYALGTMLYELLAGRPPFEATVFGQLASDIITRAPPPLPVRTPSGEALPQPLRELVMSCLSKTMDKRPPSMAALAERLRHVSSGRGRRSGPLFLVAGVATALVLGSVLWPVNERARANGAPTAPVERAEVMAAARVNPPPPPAAAPAPVPEVLLSLTTTPPRAAVSRADTGEALGTTPLELSLPREAKRLKLRFDLPGHVRVEREVSLQMDQSLELALQPVAPKQAAKPVKDGVLDPY